MADNMDGDDDIPQDNLKMLAYLLRKEAAPRDATFTTARGEGDLAKARRDALTKLHPPTLAEKLSSALSGLGMTVQGPSSDIRKSAPLADVWPSSPRYENFGDNGNVLGGRVSDSLALEHMRLPYWNMLGTPQEIAASAIGNNRNKYNTYRPLEDYEQDATLAEQIARLKAMKARNSNNPG